MENKPVPTMMTAVMRGICNRCPKCGEGKLLVQFLKTVDSCAVCGETLGDIRADDGPPWLTILIVGHIMLPLIFTLGPGIDWPQWVGMVVCVTMALALMAVILPRAKGLFIGVIWKNRQPTLA